MVVEAPEPEAKVRKVELTVEVRRKPSRAFIVAVVVYFW